MTVRHRTLSAFLLTLVSGLPASLSLAQESVAKPPVEEQPAPVERPVLRRQPQVQLAILLDTSGSMDGLIEQAKTQLWGIVNDLATAKQKGERPHLTVALYEYGKDTISASEGYLRAILPLTDDLDEVSKQLFALTTNGGEEYCAQVIQAATEGLAWTSDPSDLKIIVIAGNEAFTQGTVDFHKTVPAAAKKGIIINTIFCGPREEGVRTAWAEGALLGEGKYTNIDQGASVPHIAAPQDDDIVRLSAELNTTYVPYGAAGEVALKNQAVQDRNAAGASPAAAVQRAQTKGAYVYRNAQWDLVDAVSEKKVKLEELKDVDLPENMQKMTVTEREAYLKGLTDSRATIQKQIQELSSARDLFVAGKRKEDAGQPQTLGSALIATIREQAERRGFAYEKK